MKFRHTFFALFLVTGPALACGSHWGHPPPRSPSPASSSASFAGAAANAEAQAAAVAAQRQAQDQAQQQGQAQVQNTTAQGGAAQASNAGNTQATSYAQSYSYPRQTPPAFAGQVSPTISCADARNVGVSSPLFAASVGVSTVDKACERREDARYLWAFGQHRLAVQLLCIDAEKLGLKGCAYHAPPVVAATPPVTVAPQYVTRDQLRKVERRILKQTLEK